MEEFKISKSGIKYYAFAPKSAETTKSLIFLLLLLFISTYIPLTSFAQEKTEGKGTYNLLSGVNGHIVFNYKIQRNDSIKSGDFNFISIPEELRENEFENIQFKGGFENDLKDGKWTFNFQKLKLKDTIISKNYQYIYPTNGTEVVVNANFEEGVASENWQMAKFRIENSTVIDTILYASRKYSKGVPTGKIIGKNNNVVFEGTFDKDGAMDGIWKFETLSSSENKSLDYTEYRLFEKGFLVDHYFIFGQDTTRVNYVGQPNSRKDDGEWIALTFEQEYFEITNFSQIGFSEGIEPPVDIKTTIQVSNAILIESLHLFYKLNNTNIWTEVPGSENPKRGKVYVKNYPFSAKETGLFNTFKQLVNTINTVFDSYFNNSQIEINKYVYEDIGRQYATIEQYRNSLEVIVNVLENYTKDALLYINRDALLPHFLASYTYPDSIFFSLDDKEIREAYTFLQLERKNEITLEALISHLRLVQKELMQLEDKTNEALGEYEKKGLLQELEEQALSLRDSLEKIYLENELNKYQKTVANHINTTTKKVFNDYAKLDSEVKIDTILEVISCTENLIRFHDFLGELPAELKYVDESYTRTVWNPFTFTEMDERMKERVYSAYEDVFLPLLLNKLDEPMDCQATDRWMSDTKAVLEKMLFLINQDTKAMERQLRRETKVESILEIFELSQIQIN